MTLSNSSKIMLILLIAISQIFSPVLFVPGGESFGLSIFRVVVFSIALLLYVRFGTQLVSPVEKNVLACLAALCGWAIVSLAWSENLATGVRHVSYILTLIALAYVLSTLVSNFRDLRLVARCVSILGIFVIMIAFYEINSGQHLFRSTLQEVSELDRSLSYMTENQAWFTFGNPNDLSVHVAICALFSAIAFRSILKVGLYVFASLYLVNLLDSRIVEFSISLFLIIYLLFGVLKSPQSIVKASALIVVGGAAAAVGALAASDRIELIDVSTFIRLQLVLSAIEMASNTLLVGIGTGGFEAEMWNSGYMARTFGISNPHNGIARILAENGVVGSILFLYILLGPLLLLGKARLSNRLLPAVASSVLVLPLLLSVGSDPLSSSSIQLTIAFFWVATRLAINGGRDLAAVCRSRE